MRHPPGHRHSRRNHRPRLRRTHPRRRTPQACRVLRRKHGGDDWVVVEVALEPTIHLDNQPRNQRLDYTIIATNKAGHGPESNIVTATL